MTTQITREANPRLPRPDAYRAHLDKILPDTARPRPIPRRVRYLGAGFIILLGLLILAYFNT